jgi:glucose-6-phosphate 1-epimerase
VICLVVWNPGQAKSATMDDMHKNGYQEFVCVEVGHVHKYFRLPPGQEWKCAQTLSVINIAEQKL